MLKRTVNMLKKKKERKKGKAKGAEAFSAPM